MQSDSTSKKSIGKAALHPNPELAKYGCTVTLEKRFWKRVNKTETCWEWTGGFHTNGAGSASCGGTAPPMKANRLNWIIHYGAIPDGLQVLHRCDNRKCVRPDHLFLGTAADNMSDKVSKGRQPHKLTEQQVLEIWKRGAYPKGTRPGIRRDLAIEFGVSHQSILAIFQGKVWRHITGAA